MKIFCVPTTVYSSVKWDKDQNRLDLDAVWGNSLTPEHFGLFRKWLRDLAFLCIVALGIAMRPGKEMGLTLIIYNSFPRGSEFVLGEQILRSQPFCIFILRRLGSDRLLCLKGAVEISRRDIDTEG